MFDSLNRIYNTVVINMDAGRLQLRKKALKKYLDEIDEKRIAELIAFYFGLTEKNSSVEDLISSLCEQDPSFSEDKREELVLLIASLLYEACNGHYNSLVELLVVINCKFHEVVGAREYVGKIICKYNSDRKDIRNKSFAELLETETAIEKYISSIDNLASSDSKQLYDSLSETMDELKQQFQEIVDVLFEDSQILWWYNSKWNTYGNKPLAETDVSSHCLYLGWEAASYVRCFPGPYAIEGLLAQLVSSCRGAKKKERIGSLLDAFYEEGKKQILEENNHKLLEKLLPLHRAMNLQQNTQSEEEWINKYMKEMQIQKPIELTHKDYAYILYLEELAIKCYESLTEETR